MPTKLLLKRILAEGFRGINRPIDIQCGPRATLLLAPNGQGKSSVLGAIEWCFFGELKYQSAENRTNDELVNFQSVGGKARVRLELESEDSTLVVERSRVLRKRETTLTVTTPEGEDLEDDDAEAYLFRALGLSLDDFDRGVFLHQEGVRGLLTDEPRVRDEALDRLFGLEKLRDVLAAIPMPVVKDAVEEIQTKKQRAMDKLSGAAGMAEQNRTMHLQEATEADFEEKDLTLANAKVLADGIRTSLAVACAENGHATVDLPQVNETDDLEKLARKAKDTTKNIRLASAKGSPVDQATTKLVNIQRRKKELADAKKERDDAAKVAAEHRARLGEPEAVERRKAAIQTRIKDLEGEREVLGAQARVVADAIAYLKTIPEATTCPVCEQGIQHDHMLRSLEFRVASDQKAQNERINNDIRAAKDELTVVVEADQEATRLEARRQSAEDNLKSVLALAEALLGKSPLEDPATGLAAAEAKVLASLEGLKRAQERKEEALQAIDATVDRLRLVHKFVKADEQFAAIQQKAQTDADAEATSALDEELNNLLELEDSLEAIITAIRKVSQDRATTAIEASRDGVSLYYKRLCNHPYFDDIRIDVEDKSVKGVPKNSYTIRTFSTTDGKDTLASSRLSTGQMNCVALSVYLALKEVLTHNLGFIILDDPSQNLDTDHKAALARILGEMKGNTQLFVATQDEELQKMLLAELDGTDARAYSLAWSPKKGTAATPLGASA